MMDKNTKKLFKAAKQNLTQEVVTLIEKKGVPTTAVNKKGRTVGHYAVRKNNFDMLEYVVDKDPSILRIQDDNWYNIFHLAVKRGALNMVKYLVEKHDEDILQTFFPDSEDTGTALHRAVKFGFTDMVKYFIGERNVDPNGDVGAQKQPPLFLAVQYKRPDIVDYLIDERNANLTLVDSNGENILYEAARTLDLNLIRRVLDEKKAQIDIDSINKVGDPLICEILERSCYRTDPAMEMLKYLVEQKNPNINMRVPAYKTCTTHSSPLVFRLLKTNERVVKYLAEHGANITTVDFCSRNLLHSTNSGDFCKYLINHGVNVNQKDCQGRTPLHKAIKKNHYEVCVCLIEGGADWKKNLDLMIDLERIDLIKYLVKKMKINLNEPDEMGLTRLHRAAQRGQYNGCQLLVNYGAKVNQQDELGNTALHYAAGKNRAKICRYLLNRGANAGIKNKNSKLPAEMVSDQDQALKNVLKQSATSKRDRRGAVDYFAAAALPHDQPVGIYENGQQKIARGDLNREGYYWGGETSFPVNAVSPHLQNWFLFTQLLFRGAMNFVH